MDSDNHNQTTTSANKSRLKLILAIVLVLLVASPIVWLKMRKKTDSGVAVGVQNITDLEILARKSPTYDNLIALSAAYINNKTPHKAMSILQEAIKNEPQKPDAFNNLGVCYTMMGDYDNGIKNSQIAVDLNNAIDLYRNNLAWAKAEKAKLVAFEKTPDSLKTVTQYIDHGLNYYNNQNYAVAIDIWKQGLGRFPTDHFLLNNVGSGLMMLDRPDQALAYFQKAVKVMPQDQLTKNNLEWAEKEINKSNSRP